MLPLLQLCCWVEDEIKSTSKEYRVHQHTLSLDDQYSYAQIQPEHDQQQQGQGGSSPEHADSPLHLGKVSSRNHGWWLVVDSNLASTTLM